MLRVTLKVRSFVGGPVKPSLRSFILTDLCLFAVVYVAMCKDTGGLLPLLSQYTKDTATPPPLSAYWSGSLTDTNTGKSETLVTEINTSETIADASAEAGGSGSGGGGGGCRLVPQFSDQQIGRPEGTPFLKRGDSNVLRVESSGTDYKQLKAEAKGPGDWAVLSQLQRQFSTLSDATILRHFLQSNGTFDEAAQRIEECIVWRRQFLTFTDLPNHQTVGEGCVFYTHGFDCLGHPLLIFTPRLQRIETRDVEELVRWAMYVIEVAISRIPSHQEQVTLLTNRLGMGDRADFQFPALLFQQIERYYPNRFYLLLGFPQTLAMRTVAGVVKRVVGKSMHKIIRFANSVEELLEYVPAVYLPVEMGGCCTYQFDASDYPPPSAEFFASTHDGYSDASLNALHAEALEAAPIRSNPMSQHSEYCPERADVADFAPRANSIVGTYNYMVSGRYRRSAALRRTCLDISAHLCVFCLQCVGFVGPRDG
jgi:hypothetical protein